MSSSGPKTEAKPAPSSPSARPASTRGKRLKASFTVLLFAALGLAFWLSARQPDPVYQGKSLRTWLWGYYNGGDQAAVRNAVHQLGTNALPALLAMLHKTDSPAFARFDDWWLRQVSKGHLPDWVVYPVWHRNSAAVLNQEGVLGFQILGSEARPALPALLHMYEQRVPGSVHGTPREAILAVDPTGQTALPLFLRDTTNADEMVQWEAACALDDLHCEPRLVLPALITSLRATNDVIRAMAILRLQWFGAAAKPAVPALLPLLHDRTSSVSSRAANALKQIDPEAAIRAGMKARVK